MINKTVASDHKRSDNTYISSRISSLDTEGTVLESLGKTFLKQCFSSAWFHCVSGPFEGI